MRRLFIFALSLSPLLSRAEPDWENPAVFEKGRLPARATAMPFPDRVSALGKARQESPWCQLLNGSWKFHYSGNLEGTPAGFEQETFDASAWKEIPVPSNWQLQNHGIPLYSGSIYPFAVNPPKVTAEPPANYTNHSAATRHPVGSYRRTFTLPADWAARRTILAFDGVDSAFSVWVNGRSIGYSEDSRITAQFDITSALKPGENTLAVQVHQYSDGSYLESQDTWKLSGIYRDVFLWSSPLVELTDHQVTAGLDDTFTTGTLRFSAALKNHDPAARQGKVMFELTGLDGAPVFIKEAPFDLASGADGRIDLTADSLPAVQPWSAESPTLYRYVITLSDSAGQPLACFSGRTGFRRDEVKDGRFLHNGKAVRIKGVIRHDHDANTGHAVGAQVMREELLQMKRANINAIDTANAPNDPRSLDLCDELGFYVFAGANNDTRGLGDDSLTKDPAWLPAQLDRVRNVVERDKNHPSIVCWSPGITKGDGPNLVEGAKWIRQRDPSRPTDEAFYSTPFVSIEDSTRHLREEEKKEAAARRPLVLNPLVRAGGNGTGGLHDILGLHAKEPLFQGGFISEWKDQGLIRSVAAGTDQESYYLAYGGDFGDQPNAGFSCLNGLVNSNLQASGAWEETKASYEDIRTSLMEGGGPELKIRVTNDRSFRPLDDVKMSWKLFKNGNDAGQGDLTLPPVAPGETADLSIPAARPADAKGDFILRVRYDLKSATPWSPAGMPIGWEEFALPWGKYTPSVRPPAPAPATFQEDPKSITVTAGEVIAVVDRASGALVSLKRPEGETLKDPLRLDFWRVPTTNDRGAELDRTLAIWKEAGGKARAIQVEAAQRGNDVIVTAQLAIPAGTSAATVIYRITDRGNVEVIVDFRPDRTQPMLPRIGMTCAIPMSVSTWSWYGKGPHENYSDRNRGAWTAVHTGFPPILSPSYPLPQESGNRTEVRWANFISSNGGSGLRIDATGDSLLEIGASPYPTGLLETARHGDELQTGDRLTLHLDHRQMGVGGSNVRGATPLRPYLLPSDRSYRWSMLLTSSYVKEPLFGPARGLSLPPGVLPPDSLPPGIQPSGDPTPVPSLPPGGN